MASLTCMTVGAGRWLGLSLHVLSHPQRCQPGLFTRWQCSKKVRAEAARPPESLDLNIALLPQSTEVLFRFQMWVNRLYPLMGENQLSPTKNLQRDVHTVMGEIIAPIFANNLQSLPLPSSVTSFLHKTKTKTNKQTNDHLPEVHPIRGHQA